MRKIRNIKDHVYNRRARYAAGGTAIAFLLLMHRNAQELTEFLIEKGINPTEYYIPEAFEELQAAAH